VAGFGAALERLEPERYALIGPMRDQLETALGADVLINGGNSPRLPHVSNFSAPGWSGERLVAALDVRGLCISTGSACRVGTAEPSAAVAAMWGAERALGAVRISLGEDLSPDQLEAGIQLLLPLVRRHGAGASGDAGAI
jgi:cysteine desulfurase